MVFFRDQMNAGEQYNFRHFWTSNLSVRTDRVKEAGGFDERFPFAMHEDIELGWRLQRAFGTQVFSAPQIPSWHDHMLTPRDYFFREHRSGQVARLASSINPEFHDQVWSWLGDPGSTLQSLQRLFIPSMGGVKKLLEEWATETDRQLAPGEIKAAYLGQLPLKRLAFYQGYLDLPFNEMWDAL